MPKLCPICQEEFAWHFCRCTTYHAKDGVSRFNVEPRCRHTATWAKDIGIIEDSMRSLWNARWDIEAERLFEEYTKHWTPDQRAAYRAKVFPAPAHPIVEESYQSSAPWAERHG